MNNQQFEMMMAAMGQLTNAFTQFAQGNMPTETTKKVSQPKAISTSKKVSPKASAPVSTSGRSTDPDYVETVVNVDGDKGRVRLPARMFNRAGVAVIDGAKYHAIASDKGRGKAQASDFGAEHGDMLAFVRDHSNVWVSVVNGGRAKTNKTLVQKAVSTSKKAPAKVAPVVQSAPVSTGKIASRKITPAPVEVPETKVSPNYVVYKSVDKFISDFAAKAVAGHAAGHDDSDKLKLGLEDDARAFLTFRERRQFKAIALSLEITMKRAAELLRAAVIEGYE
jgi:hypothetical protein